MCVCVCARAHARKIYKMKMYNYEKTQSIPWMILIIVE